MNINQYISSLRKRKNLLIWGIGLIVFHIVFSNYWALGIGILFILIKSSSIFKLFRRHPSSRKNKSISGSQIDTLFRINNNRLWVEKLAESTNTTKEVAQKKLDELYVNNMVEMHLEEDKIFYSKK